MTMPRRRSATPTGRCGKPAALISGTKVSPPPSIGPRRGEHLPRIAFGTSTRPKKLSAISQQPAADGGDLWIAPDDQRVGMIARVTPPPDGRARAYHERGDLVDDVVHPARLEGGPVAGLVPARIRRRAVQHAVDGEQRDPRQVPGDECPRSQPAEEPEQGEPQTACSGSPGRRNASSTAHAGARGSLACPLAPGQAALDGDVRSGPQSP